MTAVFGPAGSVLLGVTAVFGLAWCLTGLLRRSSAALRNLVWTCAFVAVLLMAPLRWRVPHRVILTATVTAPVAASLSDTPRDAGTKAAVVRAGSLLLTLWGLGSLVMIVRLTGNAIRLRSVVNKAAGRGLIRVSAEVPGPLVAGILRPLILLPEASETWNISRRRAVLAHESAHLRRHDPAVLLLTHVVRALYWFHPLCWLAAARLRAESERACDDAALRTGLRPSGYAAHLLDLARSFDTQLAIPMATTSHLESRMKSILDPKTDRSLPARATWLAACALTAAVLAPLTTFSLRAQQTGDSSTIAGVVTDPSGAVVPRAQVTATNTDGGYSIQAVSNAVGAYSITNLVAGHYSIEARTPGFKAFQLGNLALVSGGKLQADAHLQVGNITEVVTVAAQGPAASQAAAPPAGSSKPIRVGGMVQAANLVRQVKPVYPPDLQSRGVEGVVALQAVVSKDGVPQSLTVLNTSINQEFISAAMEAVSQWRYKPTLLNGEPIEVVTAIQVNFTLTGLEPAIDDRIIDDRLLPVRRK